MATIDRSARPLARLRYAASQAARVGWYMSHYLVARRLANADTIERSPEFRPKARPGRPARIRAAFLDLFAQDLANIEAGLYPAPTGPSVAGLGRALAASRSFFEDLPRVGERRAQQRNVEVRDAADRARYPTYYLQNFHYQTGGWLTRESARLYDMQVETLFGGGADAMRRIALGALAEALRGRDQRDVRLLDVACGNGRFLAQILEAFPKLPATGVDLSPAYVAEAAARLAPWRQAEAAVGAAEALPFDDNRFDALTSVYLFHELPPRVRREAAREIARVAKPGAVFVLADSLQTGDHEDLDQMLEYFPIGFHEPYYGSYLQENLPGLFEEHGFQLESTRIAFLTKVLRFRKR